MSLHKFYGSKYICFDVMITIETVKRDRLLMEGYLFT